MQSPLRNKLKPSPARCKQSFFHVWGACTLELIEPDFEPSE